MRLFLILSFCVLLIGSGRPLLAGPALVFDLENDQVIYAEDQDLLWHPASLTKLMTAYLTFEALKAHKFNLQDKVTCSKAARRQPPSKIGLPVGKKMAVELALKALIIKSANDVAVMLAEKVSGDVPAFVLEMNKRARALGMTKTRFINPNGLPDARQVTSARDMGLLARALLRDFPEYSYFFSLSSAKIGRRNVKSYNDLLRTFEGTDGMKTGFICASGYNIVASATRQGRKLVVVVLGARNARSRRQQAIQLFEYGFRNYLWTALFSTSNINAEPEDEAALKGPQNLRNRVCNYRKKYRKRRGSKKKRKKTS